MDQENLTLQEMEYQLYLLQKMEFQIQARNDLLSFTAYTNLKYEINWHHRVLCKKLDDFANGKIRRLMVFMPPRHGKSELVSRRLPAYLLGIKPDTQIIATSYSADLASILNRDVQRIMDSEEYQELFPDIKLHQKNMRQQGVSHLRNNEIFEIIGRKGVYKSCGIGGGITGMGAEYAIIDDPFKNQEEAFSTTMREKVWGWYQSTLTTRLEKNDHILLTMTRWHDDDLGGRLIKLAKSEPNSDQWKIISFPAIKETNHDQLDQREIGEALWENKYNLDKLNRLKPSIGSYFWQAMYQQSPLLIQGGLFKRTWWNYYSEKPNFSRIIQFWDTAQKPGLTNDYSVCATWGESPNGFYLLDIWRNKVEMPDLERAIISNYNKFNPSAVIIEDKASGIGVIQILRKKTRLPIIAYDPKMRDKETRASLATPTVEAGKCFLPDNSKWVEDFILEHEKFPNSEHDDQVDTTSMMIEYMSKRIAVARVTLL